jgi:hypothetical protein
MSKRSKKPSVGQRLLTTATRFLFPGDTRHSRSYVNHQHLGDRRTRQYKDSGQTREIHSAELRRNRQRHDNWKNR